MTLSHTTKVYAVKDAKISLMTADPAGGTATYGSAKDVPGIKTVGIAGSLKSAELHGDHTLMDTDEVLEKITFTFSHAKQNIDNLAIILGGTVSDSGTTPNQIAKWALLGTDSLFNYFKLEAQCYSVDTIGGDGHLVLWKCKISSFPGLGMAEDDYQTFTVEGYALPRNADAKWIDFLVNESAVAIS